MPGTDLNDTAPAAPATTSDTAAGTPAASAPSSPAAPPAAGADAGATPPASEDRSAWLERVERAKRTAAAEAEAKHKAWLKEKFGTEDPVEAEKRAKRLLQLEADEDKRKRASMSELDRIKDDLDRERKLRADAEARAQAAEAGRMHEQQSANINNIASGHVRPKNVEFAVFTFGKYLRDRIANGERADVEAMTEKDVNRWFTDFARRNPEYAAAASAPAGAPPSDARRQPVGAGAPGGQPPPKPNAGGVVKTMRPGQPNTMSDIEARSALRKMGFTY